MGNKDAHSSKANGNCSPNPFPSIYSPSELSSLSAAKSREAIRKELKDCGFLEIQANHDNLSSERHNVDANKQFSDVHKDRSQDKAVEMAARPHHDAFLDSREGKGMGNMQRGSEDGDDSSSNSTNGLTKNEQEASSNGKLESVVGSSSSLASKDASGSIHGESSDRLLPLEPSLYQQDSDGFLPLEPSLSAPPVILMALSPGADRGEEPSASPLLVSVKTGVMQPSSPIASPGLQRAQTLPSGSLENVDEMEKSNDKDDIAMSSTSRERGRRRHHRGENVRAPIGKLSKRKQKKIMKRIATVNPNGTVEFDVNKSARFGPDLFGPKVDEPVELEEELPYSGDDEEGRAVPPLQIVMLIVGTRGDVQPFVAIGKHLQEYGHRVRLATHSNFREFVLKAGVEFFPLGGDPKVLAGYMVKNKGFLPSGPSEIRTQRKQIKSIINSLLPACTESDEDSVAFRAQAIIANPPCYGHAHVAEALKVPLHIFFTMPWTPTSEFPHPLSRVHHSAANRLSYQVVDSLIWWGIRDIINDFRKKKLKLRPITYLSGSQPSMSKLPTGYIWSPHLVPKPKDWGPKIDVVGFCFLNMSQDYNPPESLISFLKSGAAPIYVGFGSLPVEDPEGMTKIIVEALKQTSQRGIIDKGWGGIGKLKDQPDSIYLLENCPHDWLFPQCAAVVHHGGAGTTAAGLRAACPTTIVPFFGDQPFWGDRVHAKGVGPAPIPAAQFSLDKLVHAIDYMLSPEVKQRAVELAHVMENENGVVGAVDAFHRHLPKGMPLKSDSITPKTVGDRIARFKIFSCFGSTMP